MTQTSSLTQLLSIMAQLRDPETGCPWDKAQNFASIAPHTIEEAYEVADAIEKGDSNSLKKELGDLLFQIVFYCQLASEQGEFNFHDVVEELNTKLTRRHPHIFAQENDGQNWEQRKQQERQEQGQSDLLSDIPTQLPALSAAQKIQKRVASVGFDWPSIDGALDKVEEEIAEVRQAIAVDPKSAHSAEEVGDLLFATVNVARHLERDAEQILRQANSKFSTRFKGVENELKRQQLDVNSASLAQMEAAWQAVKAQAK